MKEGLCELICVVGSVVFVLLCWMLFDGMIFVYDVYWCVVFVLLLIFFMIVLVVFKGWLLLCCSVSLWIVCLVLWLISIECCLLCVNRLVLFYCCSIMMIGNSFLFFLVSMYFWYVVLLDVGMMLNMFVFISIFSWLDRMLFVMLRFVWKLLKWCMLLNVLCMISNV